MSMNAEQMLNTIPVSSVEIHDALLSRFREISVKQGLPYQWEALNDRLPDTAPSGCIKNFLIASGKASGTHYGFPFQDSDLAKWLEAVAYSLMWHPDPELEEEADKAIALIAGTQQPDGYLDTYYIINGLEKKWTNVKDHHELYIAGHMIEAAVAYYQATGKKQLLDCCCKLADHIDSIFGVEEGKLKGYPGHPEIELALVKLYKTTQNKKYLDLAKYFIDQRGQQPNYFDAETLKNGNGNYWKDWYRNAYYQAEKPVRQQKDAHGHAVRALYLYSGMEDVARETSDPELHEACKTLWDDVVNRQMYITGAVGSAEYGEAFSFDYNLPNDLVYGETCASIALFLFAYRMLCTEHKAEYADVMERTLYNSILSGMQLDGKKFFYVNPLEVNPESCEKDYLYRHVKPVRQKWFGCACCPPNILRLLNSLGQYIGSTGENTLFIHLYPASSISATVNNQAIALSIHSQYPWSGRICIKIEKCPETEFTVSLRIPGWCKNHQLSVNQEAADCFITDGYAYISREWHINDTIELNLEMPVEIIQANPRVRCNAGKLAVTRGPIVYCLEQADNGPDLHMIRLDPHAHFEAIYEENTLGGITALYSDAGKVDPSPWDQHTLYAPYSDTALLPCHLKWIPYYSWANRDPGEMTVWVHNRSYFARSGAQKLI